MVSTSLSIVFPMSNAEYEMHLATFRYPSKGGTGGLWSAVARTLPKARMNYRKQVDKVDEDLKIITFSDGTTVKYGKLLTTMPLDVLVSKLKHPGEYSITKDLFHSSSHVVSIGIRGSVPAHVGNTCWVSSHSPAGPYKHPPS